MNAITEQLTTIYKRIPTATKLMIAGVSLMLVAGFAAMFFWANKIDYQPLYTSVSPEDAGEIVEQLRQDKVPYQLAANGTTILVPAESVYDLRLKMAGSGIPRGNSVGFELFDEADFGTTEFVQKLNYQRALQGELARTIREFREVIDARVMVVMPKQSVFIEETKPPSASVLLRLSSTLSQEKISAVVHLVASAVEGLSPQQVTVVDTTGKVLSQGGQEQKSAQSPSNTQLAYKTEYEQNLAGQIQSMLEQIAGRGKAIVRVMADMDFNQVDINEEIYDPDSQVIRSRQSIAESSDRKIGQPVSVSSVNPAGFSAAGASSGKTDTNQRQDETVNYEINRTLRRTVKPLGIVSRLSVAAVLDGKYEMAAGEGASGRKYIERSPSELEQFEKIVKNAMGYDADREDQVTVSSMPFAYMADMEMGTKPPMDWIRFVRQYGRSILNAAMVLLIFLCVIRPVLKAFRQTRSALPEPAVQKTGAVESLPEPEERAALPGVELEEMSEREKAIHMAKQDIDKSAALMKSWLNEA